MSESITTKQYKANTSIAISVVLKSKKSMHVTFAPQSDGSSVFATSNKDLQDALENHYKFGRLFNLVSTTTAEEKPATAEEEAETTAPEPEKIVVKVADLQEAKDYLADKFGISRTTMKLNNKKSILEAAEAHNVVFEGLD